MKAFFTYVLLMLIYFLASSNTTPNKPIQNTQPIFEYEGHIKDLRNNTVLSVSYNKDTNTYYLNILDE